MPFKTDRLLVGGYEGKPASRPNSVDWNTNDTEVTMWSMGHDGNVDDVRYEFSLTHQNPGLQYATQLFGYDGETPVEDAHVGTVMFNLAAFPWLTDGGIKTASGVVLAGKTYISSISFRAGFDPGITSPLKLWIRFPYDTSTDGWVFGYADELYNGQDEGQAKHTVNGILSVNAEVLYSGATQTWYFDEGNPLYANFIDTHHDVRRICVAFLDPTGTKFKLASPSLACFSRKEEEGASKYLVGIVRDDGAITSPSILPYGNITFGFIPPGDALLQRKDLALKMPLLTKAQANKLFDFLNDGETEIEK